MDPVSGRATALAIHPTNPDIVYLGTAQGGLYRTLDGGATWTQLMDNAFSAAVGTPLAIGAVTIDPTNPSNVLVGTGEGNQSLDSFPGTGFYIITQADTAGAVVNGPYNFRSSDNVDIFTGRCIVSIAVDPTNHNNILVGTVYGLGGIKAAPVSGPPPRGVYRTTNAFAGVDGTGTPTWTRLPVHPEEPNGIITSLVMDPANPNNVVCALMSQSSQTRGGIYRTTNALAATPTFTQSKVNPMNTNTKLTIANVGAVVTVYATTSEVNTNGQEGTLYKSVDGGASFIKSPGLDGFAGIQGFYDIAVAVDPSNANVVSVGGNVGDNIFRQSTDGGLTFTPSVTGLHADTHWIAYAPSNTQIVYHANDGGLWRSADKGANWVSRNTAGLSSVQFSGLALHPLDANYSLAGTQDNGTEMLRPDGTIRRVDFGDGGYTSIDQNATDNENVTLYHTYFNGTGAFMGTARTLKTSCAEEGEWSFRGAFAFAPGGPYCDGNSDAQNGMNLNDFVEFYAPMTLGPGNPNTWYFGTDKLWRSTNRADTATAVSAFLGDYVSAIAISPQDDNVRLVGTELGGAVFATTTGGNSLVQIMGGGATNGPTNTPVAPVGRIAIDPNNKNVAYVAFAGFGSYAHIYKTTNLDALNSNPKGAVIFTPSGAGLPNIPINALAIDPQSGSGTNSSRDIYAGTDLGIYRSVDGGANWVLYGAGFPKVSTFGLEIQNPNRIIRAATHGRGLYDTSITASGAAAPVLTSAVSRLTHGAAGPFDINMPLTGDVGVEPRLGAASATAPGNFTIVLRFSNILVNGTATVSAGTGSVSSTTFSGTDMTVNLTGVTNAQKLTLTVSNVSDSNGMQLPAASVTMGFNVGDVNASGVVTGGDLNLVKAQQSKPLTTSNFRADINRSGVISGSDLNLTKAKQGQSINPAVNP